MFLLLLPNNPALAFIMPIMVKGLEFIRSLLLIQDLLLQIIHRPVFLEPAPADIVFPSPAPSPFLTMLFL